MSGYETLLDGDNLVVLQQLVANDWASLPVEELDVLNPGKSQEELQQVLSELQSEGYVKILHTETPEGIPSRFFSATELAREHMEELRIWSGLSVMYQIYREVEVPSRVRDMREYYPRGELVSGDSVPFEGDRV